MTFSMRTPIMYKMKDGTIRIYCAMVGGEFAYTKPGEMLDLNGKRKLYVRDDVYTGLVIWSESTEDTKE